MIQSISKGNLSKVFFWFPILQNVMKLILKNVKMRLKIPKFGFVFLNLFVTHISLTWNFRTEHLSLFFFCISAWKVIG